MGNLLPELEKFCYYSDKATGRADMLACAVDSQEQMFINLFFHYDSCFFVGGTG